MSGLASETRVSLPRNAKPTTLSESPSIHPSPSNASLRYDKSEYDDTESPRGKATPQKVQPYRPLTALDKKRLLDVTKIDDCPMTGNDNVSSTNDDSHLYPHASPPERLIYLAAVNWCDRFRNINSRRNRMFHKEKAAILPETKIIIILEDYWQQPFETRGDIMDKLNCSWRFFRFFPLDDWGNLTFMAPCTGSEDRRLIGYNNITDLAPFKSHIHPVWVAISTGEKLFLRRELMKATGKDDEFYLSHVPEQLKDDCKTVLRIFERLIDAAWKKDLIALVNQRAKNPNWVDDLDGDNEAGLRQALRDFLGDIVCNITGMNNIARSIELMHVTPKALPEEFQICLELAWNLPAGTLDLDALINTMFGQNDFHVIFDTGGVMFLPVNPRVLQKAARFTENKNPNKDFFTVYSEDRWEYRLVALEPLGNLCFQVADTVHQAPYNTVPPFRSHVHPFHVIANAGIKLHVFNAVHGADALLALPDSQALLRMLRTFKSWINPKWEADLEAIAKSKSKRSRTRTLDSDADLLLPFPGQPDTIIKPKQQRPRPEPTSPTPTRRRSTVGTQQSAMSKKRIRDKEEEASGSRATKRGNHTDR
ncbi:hypothetical protein C8J56DRAFT_1026150 [Mycena floridula]|nr:hypothetical protein C8J56DRAFT_1026150 [Mycena floridula]